MIIKQLANKKLLFEVNAIQKKTMHFSRPMQGKFVKAKVASISKFKCQARLSKMSSKQD